MVNDNQEGSLVDRAKNIRGKAFLLAHGMADRNVHFQNSILLAKTLVSHNIPFEQHVRFFLKLGVYPTKLKKL